MKMYTKDGREVLVVRQIEGGYLAKEVFEFCSDFDDEGDGPEENGITTGDTTLFFKELYEKAPTEKYAAEVASLQKEVEALGNRISELQVKASEEQATLGKISKFPILQMMADYLTGDFEFIVFLRDLTLSPKRSVYIPPNIAVMVEVANPSKAGWSMRLLGSDYNYRDLYDKPFFPFKTVEDAVKFIKEDMLNRIKKWSYDWNDKAGRFKTMFDDLSLTSGVKKDPDVIQAYQEKFEKLKALDNAEKAKKLQADIEDLEKKRKELEKIQS